MTKRKQFNGQLWCELGGSEYGSLSVKLKKRISRNLQGRLLDRLNPYEINHLEHELKLDLSKRYDF